MAAKRNLDPLEFVMGPVVPRDLVNFQSQIQSYIMPDRRCWFGRFPGVPDYIYRYTSRRNADDLLTRGRLRLGTLTEYRRAEQKYNNAQRDQEEGSRRWTTKLAGVPFQVDISSADTWIYCCSYEKSSKILNDFKVDAVVRIEVDGFSRELTRLMALHAEIGSVRNVEYMDHHTFMDGSEKAPLAMFSKSLAFEDQREVRFCFERRGDNEKGLRYNHIVRQLHGGFGPSPPPDKRAEIVEWMKNPLVEELKPIFVESKALCSLVTDVTDTIEKE